MSDASYEVLIFVALICLLLSGTGWLLLKRGQVSIIQLLAGVAFYGILLAPLRQFQIAEYPYEPQLFVFCAILLVPLVGVGIFLGSRNVKTATPEKYLVRSLWFLTGLLVPETLPVALTILLYMFSPLTFSLRNPVLLTFAAILLTLPTVATLLLQVTALLRARKATIPPAGKRHIEP